MVAEANGRERRLRLGMIGGGSGSLIGRGHRYAARLDDSFELVAGAFSSSPERALASAATLGVARERAYGDWRDMLSREATLPASERIDAVAIVTPNHLHCEQATACIEAGFHVVCDKPLGSRLADALALRDVVRRSGLVFALTHNYSGYPLVRHARAMVRDGELGDIRLVQVEYAQDWLTLPIEADGHKQAGWRQDPTQAGPGGALGDIGTHAYHLATYVTGLRAESLCADLSSFVGSRVLDDNANVLLRFQGAARGILWASQVAPGNENALRIRVYGSKAGLEWAQEEPNALSFTPFGQSKRIVTRASGAVGRDGGYSTRVPPGHPEGWIEGFAQIYSDVAELIGSRIEGRAPDERATSVPTIDDGVDGMLFVGAAVRSHQAGGGWVGISDAAELARPLGGRPTGA